MKRYLPTLLAVMLLALTAHAQKRPPSQEMLDMANGKSKKTQTEKKPPRLKSLPDYPGAVVLRPRTSFSKSDAQGHDAAVEKASGVVREGFFKAYATTDGGEAVLRFYAAELARHGFTEFMNTEAGPNGRLVGYMRGTESVSIQFYKGTQTYESYLAPGEKAPAGTNGVFVKVN